MLKSFKFKLYSNKDQIKQIDLTLNSCRFIYNASINIKNYINKSEKGFDCIHGEILSPLVALQQVAISMR